MTPTFAALRNRNFRLLWIGQLISFSGSMMQNAAILWHVSLLAPPDQKGLYLGLVGLVRVLPIIVFSLISGVVADAVNRRRLMLFTQLTMAAIAGTLAWLTFLGLTTVWPVYILAALSSAVAAFDGPARQSLVPALVPVEHLANAISLNTVMFQFAAVLGPTMAGIVLATLDVGWAYLLNGVSFLAVVGALLMMRNVHSSVDAEGRGEISLGAAKEGLRFVFSNPIIRSTMLIDFFATFFASATALLPIFAQDILHVGAHGYGILYAAPSVGAFIAGAAMITFVERIEQRGRVIIWAVVGYGIATILFGLSHNFWLTFLCLALTGVADTISTVLRNIVRQLTTPDTLRGRMTSINMMFFMGGPQLGELEAGLVAQGFGAPVSVVTGGMACLLVTFGIVKKTPELGAYRKSTPMEAGP
ncbi:MAG: major facilitator superfamily protein [bacterium]|nr:MAG: major facilitator superfamily protein [bacterium]